MARTVALANAITTVAAALYVLCALTAKLAPDFLLSFFQTWFHGVELSAVTTGPAITAASFGVGLVSFSVFAWVVTAATSALYNLWGGESPADEAE